MVYTGTTFRGSESGQVVTSTFTREKLELDEVVIEITHSGVCGTDLHGLNKDMVLGHEGVGIAVEVGSACMRVKCVSGNDIWCPNLRTFIAADFDQGSFGTIAIRKEQWLFVVPEGLKSEHAAPLMCGGATVFSPLIEYVKPIDRVGIVGVGGLGHLAIQFAAKMGCDVVVLSGTDAKREEAMKLGATEFYATKGVVDYSTLGIKKPLNHLFLTTSVAPEQLDAYYPILDEMAKIMPLTVAAGTIKAAYNPTIFRGMQIIGSKCCNRYVQGKMLEFAARNEVFPVIEVFEMSEAGANEAVKKLQEGNMRYRGVLIK
ncbi:hypothetical protein V5O48_006407 [Marasmius crinis-equi]|uniref:Uncharacterized protein n=1 Tax=Marasmius crinis-equi TaxID=585013 RepID=A0ABR3FJK2_9AGAR